MSTAWENVLREQILARRERLRTAAASTPSSARLAALLRQVDDTLERVDGGSFGLCMHCHGTIEPERLISDPMVSTCLDCLSAEQKRALEHDLNLAARVQSGLLPKTGAFDGWEVGYRYVPAGAVSGDYCDLIAGDGNLVFLVGDVSGKGVAASLLMAQLHAIFRSLSPFSTAVHELIGRANRVFCANTLATHYATLVCGSASATGEVTVCNAGHCPPLAVGTAGVTAIEATGLPLGLFCETEYTCRTFRLEPGDTLAVYTDGLSEAANASECEYGAERLAQVLTRCRGASCEQLAAACLDNLAAFRGGAPVRDDLTLMLIRRRMVSPQ